MNKETYRNRSIFTRKELMTALMSSAVTIGAFSFGAPALAQDSIEDENSNKIIIVNARKQDETLQETPVTVTSISADTLDKFQVNEVADVVSRIPALNVQVGGSGAGGQISLRGIGTTNISAAFDSAVAFDFDGVSISTMRLVQASFFDVAQIDVLKGPQSL